MCPGAWVEFWAGGHMAVKVYLEKAGCDRRQLDAETIRGYLSANDYELVDDPAQADRILVVTCAFKKSEEDASVQRLRSLRKYGRDIVVYGCLPDIASRRYAEFDDLPHVAPKDIDSIDQHFAPAGVPFAQVPSANTIEHTRPTFASVKRRVEVGVGAWQGSMQRLREIGLRSLAKPSLNGEPFNLFVCRGCTGACSYCAIKRAIARVHSKQPDVVLAELRTGLDAGYRTFNILGDDPGSWGLDISSDFPKLLSALFEASRPFSPPAGASPNGKQPVRFRIREIHPKHLVAYESALFGLPDINMVENVLCPVQSGSDRVLELMRREHTASELLSVAKGLRQRVAGVVLETQIIAGFPSETEADFEQTLALVTEASFDSVVVFPYDDKQDTEASRLDEKVADSEIQRRVRLAFRHFRKHGIRAYRSCP